MLVPRGEAQCQIICDGFRDGSARHEAHDLQLVGDRLGLMSRKRGICRRKGQNEREDLICRKASYVSTTNAPSSQGVEIELGAFCGRDLGL